jgi:hypothetical protein
MKALYMDYKHKAPAKLCKITLQVQPIKELHRQQDGGNPQHHHHMHQITGVPLTLVLKDLMLISPWDLALLLISTQDLEEVLRDLHQTS